MVVEWSHTIGIEWKEKAFKLWQSTKRQEDRDNYIIAKKTSQENSGHWKKKRYGITLQSIENEGGAEGNI